MEIKENLCEFLSKNAVWSADIVSTKSHIISDMSPTHSN